MELFLDTIFEAALAKLWPVGVFAGVTTNPLILAQAGMTAAAAARRCADMGIPRLFLQAATGTPDEIERDARRLAALFDGEIWIKIPAVGEGFAAMGRLRDSPIRTAATAVLSAGQAMLAARAGASVVIPFVGRAEKGGADPRALLEDVCRIAHRTEARVLAASVKTAEHLVAADRAGCWAATIPPALAESLVRDPRALEVVEQFRRAENGGQE
jgi:TalC/MipB family fructose-6-phosphate aldolase